MKGKILSVRLNMRELVKMEQVSRETGVSVGRLVKQALEKMYFSDSEEADLNQEIFKLNQKVENLEEVRDHAEYVIGRVEGVAEKLLDDMAFDRKHISRD